MKQADVLLLRASQLIDAANTERRDRFTRSLFRPIPNFYSNVLPAAVERIPLQTRLTLDALSEWLALAVEKGPLLIVLLLLAPLAAAVAARRFVKGLRSRRAAKRARGKPAEPTPQQRGITAIRLTLGTCLPIWSGLATFYLIATAAGIADPSANGFLLRASLVAAWASWLMSLTHHSLGLTDASWRLVAVDDALVRRLTLLLWTIVAVWLLEQIWILSDAVVFTPYYLSVLRSALAAALYGILLAAIVLAIRGGSPMRAHAYVGWRDWLLSATAILAALILIAMLLSYEALARFVGAHIVSTAGVLWIMYLLHLAAESISSVSVISGGPVEEAPDAEEDVGAPSLLTIRIIVSLLLDLAILVVGVTILLLLWRFDWVEVQGWIQAAFFGFQFGNLRLSLQSVLMALGVFALGLVLTRFLQRWLVQRVFTGRRSDTGVHESVRVGMGYLGFVLSALAGMSYLGIDFSNLAIVAGALSVGIGFGLQSIFNNFVSGIILLVERPVKIGDWISVGGHEGMVKKVSVRSTEIETIHRQSVIIPNANLITDPVTNWMHADKSCRLDIPVGVAYGTDVELLRSTLLAVAASHRGALKSPPPLVHFAGFGDSSLNFELRVFLRDARNRIDASSELRFAILAALNDAGITIPFPQRDLHIKHAARSANASRQEGG